MQKFIAIIPFQKFRQSRRQYKWNLHSKAHSAAWRCAGELKKLQTHTALFESVQNDPLCAKSYSSLSRENFASKITDRVTLIFFQTERNYNGIIVETVGKIFSFFFFLP